MKFVNLIIAAVLCIFSISAEAQEIQQNPQTEESDYEPPTFENHGMAYSVSYQSEHLDGVRYRSVPITACFNFNSRVLTGLLLKPSVITTPDRISEVHYFTVDENGNRILGKDTHVNREGENYFSIPLALMVRADFTGTRRNSLYLEVALGHDLAQKTIFMQYMLGGRFGLGPYNRKALLLGCGLVFHNPELYQKLDFGARFGVRIGYEF